MSNWIVKFMRTSLKYFDFFNIRIGLINIWIKLKRLIPTKLFSECDHIRRIQSVVFGRSYRWRNYWWVEEYFSHLIQNQLFSLNLFTFPPTHFYSFVKYYKDKSPYTLMLRFFWYQHYFTDYRNYLSILHFQICRESGLSIMRILVYPWF